MMIDMQVFLFSFQFIYEFQAWSDFEGRCDRFVPPGNFCISPEKSCTSPWESSNDRSK